MCNLNSSEDGPKNDNNHCITLFFNQMSNSVKKKIIHTLLVNILTSTEFCILIVSERSGRPIVENNYFVFSMDVSLSAINENNTEITF